jgi:hypothetical protein
MRRFLVFTILFPLLVFLVFAAPHTVRGELPPMPAVLVLVAFAYQIAIVPAWLSAAVDSALSRTPLHVRVVGMAVAGAVIAVLTALFFSYDLSNWGVNFRIILQGAIPAAVCSLLSGRKLR